MTGALEHLWRPGPGRHRSLFSGCALCLLLTSVAAVASPTINGYAQFPGAAGFTGGSPGVPALDVPQAAGGCRPPPAGRLSAGGRMAQGQQPPMRGDYLQPSLGLNEFYTDNIDLAPAGRKKSDYATFLTPALSGCTVGSRLRAGFDYTAQAIYYARSTPHNKIYNQFKGHLRAELYPDHLFFDANTRYGQAVINPNAVYSINNVFKTTNRTNVWIYELSPYWKQSFGALGLATIRYRYGRVAYSGPSLINSRSSTSSFDLSKPPGRGGLSWVLNWYSTRVRFERTGQVQYFDNGSLQLGYPVLQTLQLLAKGGVQSKYRLDGSVIRYGSPYVSAGFRWANASASLLVLYGHRYFGYPWTVQAAYQTRALHFTAAYDETITDTPRRQTAWSIAQPNTAVPITPLNELRIISVFLEKRASGRVTYLLPLRRRSRITLSIYDDRRNYRTENLGRNHITGGAVDWMWQFNPLTSFDVSFNRARYIGRLTSDSADFINRASFGMTRSLTPNARLRFVLSRASRSSSIATNEYTANSVMLQLTASF